MCSSLWYVACVMFSSMLCCMFYFLQYVVLHVLCSPVSCVAGFMFSSMLCCMFCVLHYVLQHFCDLRYVALRVYVFQNVVLHAYVLQYVVLLGLCNSECFSVCFCFTVWGVICSMFSSMLCCMFCSPVSCVTWFMLLRMLSACLCSPVCCVACFKASAQITWNSTLRNGSLGSSSPSWNDFTELSQLENLLDHVAGNCAELCRYKS